MARSFLLFSVLIAVACSLLWNGALQTQSPTSTANWTPAPTGETKVDVRIMSFPELLRRAGGPMSIAANPVSVCGWIGGFVTALAYCSTRSSCVWNSDYSIVGCCATASSKCRFYTACVDLNSPKQAGDSDDVYTCRGTSVCYSNTYPGSYKQWGCGTGSTGTDVATSYSGMIQAMRLQIVMTGGISQAAGAQKTESLVASPSAAASSVLTELQSPSSSTSQSSDQSPVTSQSEQSAASSSSGPKVAASSSSSVRASDQATSSKSTSAPSSSSAAATTKASTPVAPIVGGVAGGVAVIAFIGTLCLVGRRKKWFNKNRKH